MIKRFCLCLIAFFLSAVGPTKAQKFYDESFLQKLNEYRACVEKKQQDNALKIIAKCALYAEGEPDLSNELKILCWSLYLAEFLKQDITFGDAFTKYLDLICLYGYKYDGKPKSYGIELLVASFFILKSKIIPSEYTFCLVKALRILTRLGEMNVPPVAEKEYEPFYKILEAKDFNTEHLELLQYTHEAMEKLSGQEWFLSALSGIIKEGFSHTALYCMHQSEEKNFADAWAMHGYTCEYGIGTSKDLDQAIKYYKQAADKGSVWGKIGYANFLINGETIGKDYARALQLLNSVVKDPEFFLFGGGYQLGRLYENGWGAEVNREKAIELYTDNYEKSFVRRLKDLSYEGSLRLANKISEELVDAELAGVDIIKMSADELSAIALRYERLNAKQKATCFELQAAKKGNSYSACKVGMKYFDLSNWEKEAELEYAFKMFEMGSEGSYAPCKYNLAVMYLFGYGSSPNYEKALDLYNKYIEQVSAEGYEEYSENDYITLSKKYTEKDKKDGKPLKRMLDFFNDPKKVYSWAMKWEKSIRPEVIIYFYTRAAQKGVPEAAKRLEQFKKKISEKQKNNSKR